MRINCDATWYHFDHFIPPINARCLNMSQSGKLVKKGETDSFLWKDDEVKRLLWVTIEGIAKMSENAD